MKRYLPFLFALTLSSASAFGASSLNSLPALGTSGSTFPLPDPAVTTQNLWISQGSGSVQDFRITPTQLGYIFQGTSAPQSPFRYQLWWNTTTSPAPLEVYTGSNWAIIGYLDYNNNAWITPPSSGGVGALASQPTTDLGSIPETTIKISGSATISSFGTSAAAGTIYTLLFTGIPTIVYNSSSMILPGATNINVSVGDVGVFVSLGAGDWELIGYQPAAAFYAPLASPAFTGTPTAPTASVGTNSTQIATTGFVATSFAPIASPVFTGTPTAPTPSAGDNSNRIATTGFVTPNFATLSSPAFSGTPTAPTQASSDNSNKLATTAFVTTAIANLNIGTYAPIASPAFTGTPTAPTPTPGTNTTQLATTQFVATSFAPLASPTLSNPSFTGTVTFPGGATWTSGGPSAGSVPVTALGNIAGSTVLANTGGSPGAPSAASGGALSAILCKPVVTVYTSGTGTYTTPTCNSVTANFLEVKMVGGGGGGGGTGTSAGSGTNGGDTTFGGTLLVAGGGVGVPAGGLTGGSGGSATIAAGPVGIAIPGSWGASVSLPNVASSGAGGSGGASPFGGNGVGASSAGNGSQAPPNSGSGGGGAGTNSTASINPAGGGGAGGFVDAYISSPASTYSYSVGVLGAGGSAGTSGGAGGNGGSGVIIVIAKWQ